MYEHELSNKVGICLRLHIQGSMDRALHRISFVMAALQSVSRSLTVPYLARLAQPWNVKAQEKHLMEELLVASFLCETSGSSTTLKHSCGQR